MRLESLSLCVEAVKLSGLLGSGHRGLDKLGLWHAWFLARTVAGKRGQQERWAPDGLRQPAVVAPPGGMRAALGTLVRRQ